MSTRRIYRENRYAKECRTVITGIASSDGKDVITVRESVFYPEGGGQISDIGTIRRIPAGSGADDPDQACYDILRAYDTDIDSDVYHVTDAPSGTFSVGEDVLLSIDWDNRFTGMQRHLGEHMLSGAINRLYGGVNKGFHMGSDSVTIDIDLGGRILEEPELLIAEDDVNRAIDASLPVTVTWFDDYEASSVMPVRKDVPHDGRVSVVTVGELPDPYDCIACCGLHPETTSEVGLLSIYKCEPNKGMNRIYFDCGMKARHKLRSDSHILSEAASRYSCKTSDLISRLDHEDESRRQLKQRISDLAGYVASAEAENILNDMKSSGGSVYIYNSDLLSTDETLKLGFRIINEAAADVLVMVCPAALTCLIFSSGGFDCGRFVKENAAGFGGKGGGRGDNARALFTSPEDMKAFATFIAEMV